MKFRKGDLVYLKKDEQTNEVGKFVFQVTGFCKNCLGEDCLLVDHRKICLPEKDCLLAFRV